MWTAVESAIVGAKSQVVIPQKIRAMFKIKQKRARLGGSRWRK